MTVLFFCLCTKKPHIMCVEILMATELVAMVTSKVAMFNSVNEHVMFKLVN